jgi:hypothetical protein
VIWNFVLIWFPRDSNVYHIWIQWNNHNSPNCCCESVMQLRDIADLVRHASVLLLQDPGFNCRKLFYKKYLRRTLFHQALYLATSYPGFSLCGRGLKRTLAKAAEHYVICCMFLGGVELSRRACSQTAVLFKCLFIEIMKSLILLIDIATFMAWNVLNYVR